MSIHFTDHDHVSEPEATVVDAGLDAANQQTAAFDDVLGLSVFARTAENEGMGTVVGGAVGRTWGECCELQELWVAPDFRKQGIASTLLQRFEQLAIARDCRLVYLHTFSFQAPDFYRSHGYHLAFTIQGYTQGVEKYLMQKTLAAPGAAIQAITQA